MHKYILILLLCFSCKNSQKNEPQSKTSTDFNSNVETILDEKIPEWQVEYNVPAVAIGLIENGKIRLTKVYGEHQKGMEAPQSTIFNVASITKPMVAIATLKLVDNGQWDLDEPLHKYWIDPDLKNEPLALKLTTRHVLSHTTGFLNWRRMHPTKKLKFDFEPGTRYQYSGEGFEYLASALEKKFNSKLSHLIDSLVFDPMNMKDATLSWLEDKDTIRFAKWYDGKGNPHNEYYKTHWVSAADDLLVTIEDLANFGIKIMDGSSLSPNLYSEMIKTQAKIHNNANQGLGWTVVSNLSNGEYLINHDGGDVGVAATLILLPKSKNGIIVLTNGDNGSIICKKLIKESIYSGKEIIEKIYWGGEIPEVISISDDLLKKYSGDYMSSLGRKITFHKKDKTLVIDGVGIPQLSLYPQSEDTFFPMDFELQFVFKKDSSGKVKSFSIVQSDKETITGEKINK
ncbi:serine hydrolase domain-containing protein [Xanthovirga aplysinae]|uniref:serine hydrolase domain-containing protein n=1 Tax=Xanthovirga aplysinae TaxID=2529853 RepID=UPI0012BCD944|nr:serine hydrolase domain-containing protein [Xanthovirga aplysinae]MTI29799.1 class A beta-lactamase-related serine hydrolase [Xanthovirga aplysinae]